MAHVPQPTQSPKDEKQIWDSETNVMLIIQLFFSLQSRSKADMVEFFTFENQRGLPSLGYRIFYGYKRANEAILATLQIVNMVAIIRMVSSTTSLTFAGYVTMHVVPFLKAQMTTMVEQMDDVWYAYLE